MLVYQRVYIYIYIHKTNHFLGIWDGMGIVAKDMTTGSLSD